MKTVLVAEDDPMFQELLGEILRGAGYKVLIASDGQEAWEKLQARGADLAVFDLNMPRLNGYGLTRRIRSDRRFNDLPILMLSVRDEVSDQVSGYDTGADDYLTKPFERGMLLTRLKVLERRALHR